MVRNDLTVLEFVFAKDANAKLIFLVKMQIVSMFIVTLIFTVKGFLLKLIGKIS